MGSWFKRQRLQGPNKKTQDTNFSMIWAKSPCTNDVNIGSNKTHMAAVAQLFATKKARSGPEKLAQIKEHGSTSTVKQQKADRIKNESLSHAWFKSMQCTSKASETESAATTVQPNIPIIPRIRGKAKATHLQNKDADALVSSPKSTLPSDKDESQSWKRTRIINVCFSCKSTVWVLNHPNLLGGILYQYSRTRRWGKFQKWKNIWIKKNMCL